MTLSHKISFLNFIGCPSWANTNPIDPGTLIVVTSGIEIICDRYKLLKSLILASKT
mgnify:CR=1